MTTLEPQLLVVLPAFNEEESIEAVVRPWFEVLDREVRDFQILAIDDGSEDGTLEMLERLRGELGPRIEIRSRANRGHGQTCLEGYREAVNRAVRHVLQIDSDGQCDPLFFPRFWQMREEFDVIYGHRRRGDGVRRVIASGILKACLRLGFWVNCVDANVPYRLMQTESCRATIEEIPPDFNLANIAMAVELRRRPEIREGVVPIVFRERIGGEPSVPFSRFAIRALELFRQLRHMNRVK